MRISIQLLDQKMFSYCLFTTHRPRTHARVCCVNVGGGLVKSNAVNSSPCRNPNTVSVIHSIRRRHQCHSMKGLERYIQNDLLLLLLTSLLLLFSRNIPIWHGRCRSIDMASERGFVLCMTSIGMDTDNKVEGLALR